VNSSYPESMKTVFLIVFCRNYLNDILRVQSRREGYNREIPWLNDIRAQELRESVDSLTDIVPATSQGDHRHEPSLSRED
jgi:hypothetical protein